MSRRPLNPYTLTHPIGPMMQKNTGQGQLASRPKMLQSTRSCPNTSMMRSERFWEMNGGILTSIIPSKMSSNDLSAAPLQSLLRHSWVKLTRSKRACIFAEPEVCLVESIVDASNNYSTYVWHLSANLFIFPTALTPSAIRDLGISCIINVTVELPNVPYTAKGEAQVRRTRIQINPIHELGGGSSNSLRMLTTEVSPSCYLIWNWINYFLAAAT